MAIENCVRLGVVAFLVAGLAACAAGPSEEELRKQELDQQLTTIQEEYATLQQEREEVASLQAEIAELEAIPENTRSEEQVARLEEARARLDELRPTLEKQYDQLQGDLANYLNVALNEFPQSEETQEALRIYSEEAILWADDAVEEAGDYKKAINHLQSARSYFEMVDLPVYPALEEKIVELKDWQYVTRERFDQVKKGMTKDEVKEIMGVPYVGNIKIEEDRGVEMWLYRKAESGAAGIYFKTNNDKVYATNWEAVKTRVVE